MLQTHYSISPDLIALAKNISCNFIDARTTSKDYVKALAAKNRAECLDQATANTFLLSTCLRHEIYDCSNSQQYRDPFFYVRGHGCIRRLLSVLVGLQSEIVGEREILGQTEDAINKSQEAGCLDESVFRGLKDLITVSQGIREGCNLNSIENYSTIAADLFLERLATRPDLTVAIVGGGYMGEKFFSALIKAKTLKIKKLFWINRSTSRIKNHMHDLSHVLDFDTAVLDLESGTDVLQEANAIFCALSNSPYYYENAIHKDGALIVDVSYPQVFAEEKNVEVINILNTRFGDLIKHPVAMSSITLANKEIDAVVSALENQT